MSLGNGGKSVFSSGARLKYGRMAPKRFLMTSIFGMRFSHVTDSFSVRRQVAGEERLLMLNNITVDCGAKGVAC
jgi:hypothetical protein